MQKSKKKKLKTRRKLVVESGEQLDTWGTPEEVLDIVRGTFGGITLDLASSAEANKLVRAPKYYSETQPCPEEPPSSGEIVWCNPPGPVEKVRWFWLVWMWCVSQGAEGAFLIFNLDHWRTLAKPDASGPPLYVSLPRSRLRFVGAPAQYNHPSGIVSTKSLWHFDGNVARW